MGRVEQLEQALDHLVEVGGEQGCVVDAVAEVDERHGRVGVHARDRVLERLQDDRDDVPVVEGLQGELKEGE